MIIQASHLNHGFMQKLQARKAQGGGLGEAESLLVQSASGRLGSGLSVASPASGTAATYDSTASAQASLDASAQSARLAAGLSSSGLTAGSGPQTVGETVADEIVRRMDELTDENGEAKDVSGLRDSLADALDWVREQYGDEAGAAAAGMLMASTSGGVSEESIGDGLLDTLKFIDRNFGYAAGDSAIAKFNSGVNRELNEYFDNGQDELFYVADSGASSTASSAVAVESQDITARFFARAVQDSSDGEGEGDSLTQQLLDQLKSDLEESGWVTDLASQLEEEFNPGSVSMPRAMNAYLSNAVPAQPQLASIAV